MSASPDAFGTGTTKSRLQTHAASPVDRYRPFSPRRERNGDVKRSAGSHWSSPARFRAETASPMSTSPSPSMSAASRSISLSSPATDRWIRSTSSCRRHRRRRRRRPRFLGGVADSQRRWHGVVGALDIPAVASRAGEHPSGDLSAGNARVYARRTSTVSPFERAGPCDRIGDGLGPIRLDAAVQRRPCRISAPVRSQSVDRCAIPCVRRLKRYSGLSHVRPGRYRPISPVNYRTGGVPARYCRDPSGSLPSIDSVSAVR